MEGFEINHAWDAFSCVLKPNGTVEIDIGEDWYGADHPEVGIHQGFQRYLDFKFTREEALKLKDWLTEALNAQPGA